MEEIALNWEVTPRVSLYRSKIESFELEEVYLPLLRRFKHSRLRNVRMNT